MKKQLLILTISLLLSHTYAQTTISAGNVSGTWAKTGSPYKVNGIITIPNGSTLTIQPGVRVEFAQKMYLKVDGRILAQGGAKSTDSIWFTKQLVHDTGSWKGIKFIKTATTNDTSIFQYCVFRNCKSLYDTALANRSGGITILGYGKVKIKYSTFYKNEASHGACIYITRSSYAKIQACMFKQNKIGQYTYSDGNYISGSGFFGSAIAIHYASNNIVIDSCTFKNNMRGKNYGINTPILDATTVDVRASSYYKVTASAIITNSIFDGNEGITLFAGNKDAKISVANCSFINSPKDKSFYVVDASSGSKITINNANFSNNKSIVLLNSESANIKISNSLITNNENFVSIVTEDPTRLTSKLTLDRCKIMNNNKSLYDVVHTCGLTASEISNTLIANNKFDVLNSYNIRNTTIVNNIFGVDEIGGRPNRYPNSYAYYLTCVNSIIWGNKSDSFPGKQIFLYPGTTGNFKNNIIQNDTATFGNYAYGKILLKPSIYKNNLSTNPQFVNPTAGVGVSYNAATADFSLKNTCAVQSSGINAGSTDTLGFNLPKTDLAGNTRFYENRLDIGSYENTSGVATISILKQAKNDTLCEKSRTAQLSLNAIGKGLGYQWQESTNGGTNWTDIAAQTVAKLSLTTTTAAQNTTLYRAILTGSCTADTSATKQIITYNLPIVNLGKDTAVCKGETLNKSTANTGTYLWHTANTSNSLSQTIYKDSIWWLQITSTQGCKNRDSIKITAKSLPTVSLGADINLNATSQLTLDAGAAQGSYRWSNGSTGQTYSFKGSDLGAAGKRTVWVKVTGANGCSQSDSINITVVDNSSIGSISNMQVKVYPNPAQAAIYIQAKVLQSISLYSIDGKAIAIYTTAPNATNYTIPIDILANGIYMLKIEHTKGVISYINIVKGN